MGLTACCTGPGSGTDPVGPLSAALCCDVSPVVWRLPSGHGSPRDADTCNSEDSAARKGAKQRNMTPC
ncbi:hypothetical protein ACOMHN_056928 [Nucella lapillus]